MQSCDLESKEFEEIIADADCFIHCAAYAAPKGTVTQFQKNVDITDAVIPVLQHHDVFTIFKDDEGNTRARRLLGARLLHSRALPLQAVQAARAPQAGQGRVRARLPGRPVLRGD